MTTFYVDTSHHDRDRRGSSLDWAAILAATSPIMITKLTEGDPGSVASTDPYGVQALRDARAAGATMRGGYHVPRHGDQASTFRQVDFFRRQLDLGGANWAMLDSEPFDELGTNWPRFSDIVRFDDRWHALEDRVLVHYLPRWFWEQDRFGRPALTGLRGPLVCSDYADNAAFSPSALYVHCGGNSSSGWAAYGGRPVDIFQFGSRCRVPGASTTTDINAYRGTVPQLISLLQGKVGSMPTLTDEDALAEAWRVEALAHNRTTVLGGPLKGEAVETVVRINKISTDLATLAGKTSTVTLSADDRAAIAAAVLAGLNMTALAETLADTIMARISTLHFGVLAE